MISKLKDIELFKIILPLVVTILLAVSGVLVAQTLKKLDGKVDHEVVQRTLEVMEVKQKYYEKEAELRRQKDKEQDNIDQEILKLFQNLNTQIIILNERSKKE